MKHFVWMALCAILTLVFPMGLMATPACDNFGQDWNINLGAFGGVFPGTLIVTGCRDCDQSLNCGGAPPLDGAATLTSGAGGAAFTVLFSMTAYKIPGNNACVSTHWTGSLRAGALSFGGNVSNEGGPFGAFTITFGPCRAGAGSSDPALDFGARWSGDGDSGGNGFIQR